MALYPRYTRVIGTHLLVRHCLCYDDTRASCFCLCLLALAREWRSACRLHIDAAPSLSPAAADRRTRGGVGTSLSSPEQRVFPLPRGLTGTLMVDHPRSLLLAGARATCSCSLRLCFARADGYANRDCTHTARSRFMHRRRCVSLNAIRVGAVEPHVPQWRLET